MEEAVKTPMSTAISISGLVKAFGATRALDGLVWLLAVTALLVAAGLAGFRRRDLSSA